MSIEKRTPPHVDPSTRELETLLAQFSDEEIASGIIASGAAFPDERHTVEALVEQLNEARRKSTQE